MSATRIRFPSAVGVLFTDEPNPYSVGKFVGGGSTHANLIGDFLN